MEEAIRSWMGQVTLPAWEALPDFGLYMDQVILYIQRCYAAPDAGQPQIALTAAMVNNYVKSGLVARPAAKKYGRESLAQLIMIGGLKQTTSLQTLMALLHPGGQDTQTLYQSFCAGQKRVFERFAAQPFSEPLAYALEASCNQFLCSVLTAQRAKEKPIRP